MAVYFRGSCNVLRNSLRSLATVASQQPTATSSTIPSQADTHTGPLRPHLRVPVNPNHGLYGFFRVKTHQNSHTEPAKNGGTEYVSLEPPLPRALRPSGRSWEATELRRKSFRDLHTLWYILLRERNLLATQAAERKRAGIFDPSAGVKDISCRKSMARIKAVLSEREYAHKDAVRLRRVLRRNAKLGQHAAEAEDEGTESLWETDGGAMEAATTDTTQSKTA